MSDGTDKKYTVYKFGGTSVGTSDGMRKIVDYIEKKSANGPIAVVVSAMGDTTDRLILALDLAASGELRKADQVVDVVGDLASSVGIRTLESMASEREVRIGTSKISALVGDFLDPLRRLLYGVSLVREKTGQTRDLVLSFGERLSARVLCELLHIRGISSLYVDSRNWTVTDDSFGRAEVDWDSTLQRITELKPQWKDKVAVNTGFLGKTSDNRTTTIGRNGSDYTATLLARALDAREVVVSTDVSGVMTADPNIVEEAYAITNLSYMEALEMANFGARMFHSRTMVPLIRSGIPMRIKSTLAVDGRGTIIDGQGSQSENQPTSITSLENLALLDVEWLALTKQANMAARVLDALSESDITVWMATQAGHGQAISVVIPMAELDRAKQAVEEKLAAELQSGDVVPISQRTPVTLLTLVAGAMGHTPNVAGQLFSTLGAENIMLRAIAQGASERSISCVIDASDTIQAVRTVHAAFNLDRQ